MKQSEDEEKYILSKGSLIPTGIALLMTFCQIATLRDEINLWLYISIYVFYIYFIVFIAKVNFPKRIFFEWFFSVGCMLAVMVTPSFNLAFFVYSLLCIFSVGIAGQIWSDK